MFLNLRALLPDIMYTKKLSALELPFEYCRGRKDGVYKSRGEGVVVLIRNFRLKVGDYLRRMAY